jgi:hypothetical protein
VQYAVCIAAFRSGAVMGFLLAGLGLLNLFIAIVVFIKVNCSFDVVIASPADNTPSWNIRCYGTKCCSNSEVWQSAYCCCDPK